MKITMKKNLIFVLGLLLVMGFTACSSEIEDGTTDIDSWPMPYEEVKGEYTYQHPFSKKADRRIKHLSAAKANKCPGFVLCQTLFASDTGWMAQANSPYIIPFHYITYSSACQWINKEQKAICIISADLQNCTLQAFC